MKKISTLNLKIGKKLKTARITAGYTQEQISEKLNCSSRYIGLIETNRTNGSIEFIIELCNLYGISLNDVYGDYLTIKYTNEMKNLSSIIGYNQLSEEYKSIIDNNIEYLNILQKRK
ncbi:MAG: helix-turn-helix transcriptional regulator [Clostridia bacterium]|nr:helix-turn-helix transcriptional regulator [Clostridia bacterium]